jgi:AraC-like DNA-binding protein
MDAHSESASNMLLLRHYPAPPLDALVESFWWSERSAPQAALEHMLPNGTAQLIFALSDAPLSCTAITPSREFIRWRRGIVHGPQSGYYVSGPKPGGAVVGVAFRPGAAGAVLGLPAAELANRHVPVEEIWGARARLLHERLCAVGRPAAMFQALEQELNAGLRRPLLIHPAVAYSLVRCPQEGSRTRVAQVQRDTGYSPRHFIALFRASVGLAPGQFYRIERFGAVLRALAQAGPERLADIAVAAGYADQPHLTREFKEFAGITPTQYRPRSPDSPNHHLPQDGGRPAR